MTGQWDYTARQAGYDLADPRIRKFMELYTATQNLPRHLG